MAHMEHMHIPDGWKLFITRRENIRGEDRRWLKEAELLDWRVKYMGTPTYLKMKEAEKQIPLKNKTWDIHGK